MKVCPRCRRRFDAEASFCPLDGGRLRRAHSERVGTVIGDQLRLDEPLGQGAMGTVFRGFQLGVERPVAVKLLHAELADDPELVTRFLREARAAARLSSPHIVAMHLVGETDDAVPYLAMELVDGEPLEAIAAAGPIHPARAAELGRQIAVALADAHAAGVIHRDLKPSNVVVARRGTEERAVVLDFGIAKLDGPATGPATRVGALFGTPSYLAPEQADGHAAPASDVYSLGVILYRLLSGELPFTGGGVEVIVAHAVKAAPPVAARVPGLDAELADLVMRCLAKAPEDRPSASSAARRLAAIRARLITPVRRARPERRGRALYGVALAAVLVVGGAAGARELGASASARAAFATPGAASPSPGPGPIPSPSPTQSPGPSPTPPAAALAVTGEVALPPSADRRSLVLSGERLSLRAQVPRRLAVDDAAAIELDVWDEAGEPLAAPEVALAVAGPDGTAAALTAHASGLPGRYRVALRFAVAGEHRLAVQAGDVDEAIELVVSVAPR